MKRILLPLPAMRNITLFMLALAALTACTSDTFVGSEEEERLAKGETPISFGFDVPAATRASGAEAATALGNQFIVYGEKSEDGATAPAAGNYVFPNYQVNYAANTAYTTTSNTKNWEYVGYTHTTAYQTNIKTKDGSSEAVGASNAAQTIKYWDYSATNYVFTAVSAQQSDITAGNVTIQKNTSGSTVFDKGYTVTLAPSADPTKLYFSDRQVIDQGTGTNRTAPNAYGGNVTLTFRNAASQIRVGMYETIDGYEVKIKKFYYQDNANPAFASMSTPVTTNFTANVPNLSTTSAATLKVTYYADGTRVNQPKIAVTGTVANYITLAGSGLAADVTLATAANSPTYDNSGSFTTVFPQESNDKNLMLKLDYQLYNPVTRETINVTGATAEIPAEYLQWKPNFKYTYLFKISRNTNGSTGQGVVGLYPITFDAVSIEAENGEAEYITTVSEPSITTFGVKAGKYQVDKDEYEAGSDIYATIMDGSSVVDFTLGTNVNVYLATTTDATNFPITEASVAESLAEISTGTKKITTTLKNTDGTTSFTAAPVKVTTVPTEDGLATTINALKLTGAKATTATTAYVIEYIKTAATYNTTGDTYADQTAFDAAGTLYSDADGTTVATYAGSSTTYYKRVSLKTMGKYAYKVIRVAAAH